VDWADEAATRLQQAIQDAAGNDDMPTDNALIAAALREAYRKGAEDMRERAAKEMEAESHWGGHEARDHIRALPLAGVASAELPRHT